MEKLRQRRGDAAAPRKIRAIIVEIAHARIRVINCLSVIRVQDVFRKVQFHVFESHKSRGDRIDNRDSCRAGKGAGRRDLNFNPSSKLTDS
jgi:hypothetical protein